VINLTEWQEPLNKAFEEGKTCILASADATGQPDIAFKGSMMIFDEDHMAWWERSLAEQIAQVEENPKVVIHYYNRDLRLNLRFYGVATLHREGPTKDAIYAKVIPQEKEKDPEHQGFAVSVQVNRVRAGSNTVQERD
jgi:hypothetical protein